MGATSGACDNNIRRECSSECSSVDLSGSIEKLSMHNRIVHGFMYLHKKGVIDYNTALQMMVLQLAESQEEAIRELVQAESKKRVVYIAPKGLVEVSNEEGSH